MVGAALSRNFILTLIDHVLILLVLLNIPLNLLHHQDMNSPTKLAFAPCLVFRSAEMLEVGRGERVGGGAGLRCCDVLYLA